MDSSCQRCCGDSAVPHQYFRSMGGHGASARSHPPSERHIINDVNSMAAINGVIDNKNCGCLISLMNKYAREATLVAGQVLPIDQFGHVWT